MEYIIGVYINLPKEAAAAVTAAKKILSTKSHGYYKYNQPPHISLHIAKFPKRCFFKLNQALNNVSFKPFTVVISDVKCVRNGADRYFYYLHS